MSPVTKELYGGWCHGGYEIKLVDIPAWRLAVLEPVPVPARLPRPHTLVRAMQNEQQPLGLTRPVQGRVLRLIQALITAAEAEGHSCSAGATGFAPPSHRRRRASPHFTITARGQTVGFLVLQEQDRTEHVATEKELADAKKHSWIRIPRFDYTPSERLRFVLSGGQPHRASEWSDAPDHPLEDQLAEIAQEVTLRGEAAERRRLDEIEAARQKRIRWEAAMEDARIQYAEAYRFRHFEAQEAAWRHATGLTEYLSAARTLVEAMPPGQTRPKPKHGSAGQHPPLSASTHCTHHPDCPTSPTHESTTSGPSSGTGAPTAPDTTPTWHPSRVTKRDYREVNGRGSQQLNGRPHPTAGASSTRVRKHTPLGDQTLDQLLCLRPSSTSDGPFAVRRRTALATHVFAPPVCSCRHWRPGGHLLGANALERWILGVMAKPEWRPLLPASGMK
ncbi:hypothetical protein PV963_36750 [Streptomyces coeruleorubidus]|uniref:hypothetical protein n=1 Tax=Streptomyces coeruleorubidus TaxID=116188 RepID=UPI00237F1D85|nr:hypothetical protein [Streptomyces coeruleorubidus]WDV55512.1 hypothetical protein PV963_36750 [Streptomyces coeruleorubidus]